MTPIDWIILIAYLAGMLGIGFVLSRRQEDESGFFLGDRSMPSWAVSISIVATSLSAGTFVGLPEVTFKSDLTFLMLLIGSTLGGVLAAVLVVPVLYRAGTMTIYGYLRNRLGPRAEVSASWFFLVGLMLSAGARHFIASIVVALMVFGSAGTPQILASIVILGTIATVYTAAGGIRAVIWTDVLQVIILTGAAIICIVCLLNRIPLDLGGVWQLLREAPDGSKLTWFNARFEIGNPYTIWAAVLGYGLVNVAQYGCDQDMVQRMLTCKSPWKASLSMIVSRLISVPIVMLFLVIGLLLYVFYSRPDVMGGSAPADAVANTRNVFPQFILAHLPPGIVGLAVAGMLAASMSSFDSAANAMASTIQGNLRRRKALGLAGGVEEKARSLLESRRTVYWMGGGLTLFSALAVFLQEAGGQRLIDFAFGVLTFSYAGLFGVFMASIFTARGNERSALAALWTGAVVVLLMQPYILPHWTGALFGEPLTIAWPWWMLLGGGSSFLVCIAGRARAAQAVA